MHMEKLMVYFAMVFAVVLEIVQMRHGGNLAKWNRERWAAMPADAVKAEVLGESAQGDAAPEAGK